ncbi:MAG: methyltransferase domain-containing protein [Phaeodactylibacter sp.]|nr:methyltransferase domain-containing protein [Phaeodactylibacter sp.]
MMSIYDKYYQREELFGEPYPELIAFFSQYPERGKLLDLGCGQGRNAIPLARLGYEVTGIDLSEVGTGQMIKAAGAEGLELTGKVGDIYEFGDFAEYDFLLLDSMFHFTKKDKGREVGFIKRMIESARLGAVIVFCILNTGKKVPILKQAIQAGGGLEELFKKDLLYEYRDGQAGHGSRSKYKILAGRKE